MCWDGLISLSECQTSVSLQTVQKRLSSQTAASIVARRRLQCGELLSKNVAGEFFSRLLEAFFAGRAAKDLNELGQPSDLHGVVGLGVNSQEVFEHA